MARERVTVVGSINFDITTYVADFPSPNQTVLGDGSALAVGGKGLNQAVAARRAGAQVALVGCVGGDLFGRTALDYLSDNEVDAGAVQTVAQAVTGTASILVTHAGANMIAVAPGANACLTAEMVLAAADLIAAADVVLVQMEIPPAAVRAALEIATTNGVFAILNPAPVVAGTRELLAGADLVTPNEIELAELAGCGTGDTPDLEAATARLVRAGAKNFLVTLGGEGSALVAGDTPRYFPAFGVEVVDPTGAGDTFNGALAAMVAQGSDLAGAIEFASAAAAISVTRRAVQDAAPTRTEILALIARTPRS